MGLKKVKLLMVTAENNNKFYDMEDMGNGTLRATWGRVAVTSTITDYNIDEWDRIYRSKIKKGYKDVTELFIEDEVTPTGLTETVMSKPTVADKFTDARIESLVRELIRLARGTIRTNYTVSSDSVTQKQVDRAQEILDELASYSTDCEKRKNEVNKVLLELYSVIPRKMKHVSDHIINNELRSHQIKDRFGSILMDEQNLLDVMAGQVQTKEASGVKSEDEKMGENFLDSLGLELHPITPAEETMIKKLMQEKASMFVKAFRVVNKNTHTKYNGWIEKAPVKRILKFWHGSRSENWWSILNQGLKIKPAGIVHTGSMFGNGIYFADKFNKSLGYTSLSGSRWANGNEHKGYMGVYDVHVGKQYEVDSSVYSMDWKNLRSKGEYDSLWAKKGRSLYNDEFIIYKEDQCTVSYIVEIR